jgi:hypothetical protein
MEPRTFIRLVGNEALTLVTAWRQSSAFLLNAYGIARRNHEMYETVLNRSPQRARRACPTDDDGGRMAKRSQPWAAFSQLLRMAIALIDLAAGIAKEFADFLFNNTNDSEISPHIVCVANVWAPVLPPATNTMNHGSEQTRACGGSNPTDGLASDEPHRALAAEFRHYHSSDERGELAVPCIATEIGGERAMSIQRHTMRWGLRRADAKHWPREVVRRKVEASLDSAMSCRGNRLGSWASVSGIGREESRQNLIFAPFRRRRDLTSRCGIRQTNRNLDGWLKSLKVMCKLRLDLKCGAPWDLTTWQGFVDRASHAKTRRHNTEHRCGSRSSMVTGQVGWNSAQDAKTQREPWRDSGRSMDVGIILREAAKPHGAPRRDCSSFIETGSVGSMSGEDAKTGMPGKRSRHQGESLFMSVQMLKEFSRSPKKSRACSDSAGQTEGKRRFTDSFGINRYGDSDARFGRDRRLSGRFNGRPHLYTTLRTRESGNLLAAHSSQMHYHHRRSSMLRPNDPGKKPPCSGQACEQPAPILRSRNGVIAGDALRTEMFDRTVYAPGCEFRRN